MLTKTDLSQIRKIVREEVETEIRSAYDELQGEMKMMRIRIETRLGAIENKVKDLDIKVNGLEVKVNKVQRGISRIKKDIKAIISYFDQDYIILRKRIERIEGHLSI
ncbi:MAG: hypothetical protein AAB583_03475 [Patescibacteria group bacterium]|mgnify:CR=1 FL=1